MIERDVENDTFYENLLLKVIPTETGEKTSGYIVKYTPLYNNNNEVITTNKEITALFGKYSNNCYLVYTYGGYFDGQGEWKPTLDVSMYCTHGGGGGDGGSGGEGGASSGGGSSGGGILGGTEQNTNAPPPPQNQNGQVNPQDVVVMSVLSENLEVVTTDPCIKANLLKNDSIFKAKLNDLKISATNNNFETTNVLSKNNLNVETNQYNYSIVNGNANSPSANYLFYPSISVGMLHNHYGNLLSIFTIQDLIDMYNIVKDPQVNSEELVFGLVTKAGTVYLITISDKEKFIKFGNKNLLKYSDYVYLESEVNKNYEIRTDRTNDQNELGFIKMLKDFDVGVNFLKGNTTDFNSWERKEIDKRNKVLTINCN